MWFLLMFAIGWVTLKLVAEEIVDHYVMVSELPTNTMADSQTYSRSVVDSNPHTEWIVVEHNYCFCEGSTNSNKTAQKKRKLPQWLADSLTASLSIKKRHQMVCLLYCLIIWVLYSTMVCWCSTWEMQFMRVMCQGWSSLAWECMLLHWRHTKHTRYSFEVCI